MSKAVEMLREFANHQGSGIRGVVRMLRMQKDAKDYLAKLDKRKSKPMSKESEA